METQTLETPAVGVRPSGLQAVEGQRSVREHVTPLGVLGAFVGMTALFAYYRSATFMGPVFPAGPLEGGVEPEWLVNPSMPLGVLVLAVVLGCSGSLGSRLASSPVLAAALGPLGSFGAAVILLVNAGVLPFGWNFVAVALCAASFVGAVVLAGPRLCSLSVSRMVGVLVVAHMAAFLLFVLVRYTPAVQWVALATPVLAVLPWLACPLGAGGEEGGERGRPLAADGLVPKPGGPLGVRRCLRSPMLWLFTLLVLATGTVRSLLSEVEGPNDLRTLTCFLFSVALIVAWAAGALVGSRRPGGRFRFRTMVGAFSAYAAVVVAIFLAAVFGYLVLGWEDGVYVVASARSALDCLWWVVLCFVVQREKLPAVTAFLLWGCATWALQWLVCYWVLPRLLFDGAWGVSPWGVVVGVLLLLVCALLALCAVLLAVRWRGVSAAGRGTAGDEGRDAWGEAAGSPVDRGVLAEQRLVEGYGLTEREAQVAVLFAEGFSLGAVAERLGMGKSTAQSHSKAIYRKCAIHTKDELIAIVRGT